MAREVEYKVAYENVMIANKMLRQENQQLKEDVKDLDSQKEMMFKNMQLNQLKVCELAKVLDEIREYIKTHVKEHIHDDYDVTLYYSLNQDECDELLQILDKVGNN